MNPLNKQNYKSSKIIPKIFLSPQKQVYIWTYNLMTFQPQFFGKTSFQYVYVKVNNES